MNDLMPFTKIIITILMFIGAAPASTAGGIKITTVALVVCTVISVLKGREDTYLMGHRIKRDAIYKTFTVIVLSLDSYSRFIHRHTYVLWRVCRFRKQYSR